MVQFFYFLILLWSRRQSQFKSTHLVPKLTFPFLFFSFIPIDYNTKKEFSCLWFSGNEENGLFIAYNGTTITLTDKNSTKVVQNLCPQLYSSSGINPFEFITKIYITLFCCHRNKWGNLILLRLYHHQSIARRNCGYQSISGTLSKLLLEHSQCPLYKSMWL